jgi:cell division protein FtsW
MRVKFAVTVLVFCVAGLLSLGLVMLYSSTMADKGSRLVQIQLIWSALGLLLGVSALLLDYRFLKKIALPLFVLALVLLALVFVPHIGVHRNGASRWLGYNKVSLFQPSEFAKLALIITLAWYGDRYQRQMPTFKRGILIPGILVAMVLGLIFREPDRGTTILLAGVSGTMLLVAGVRWRFIVPPVLAGFAALAISLFHDPMRRARIMSWWELEKDKKGVGYQAYEAMLALGVGGWLGRGLGNSRQKLGFVPEQHTDFIFSIIGEELGLIATVLVVIAFVAIVLSGIYIAMRSPDTFGMLLGSGIAFMIGLQAVINIGVVTSALPNKGLPLPFISYGGSNLVLMLTSVGVLLSVARQAREPDPIEAREPQTKAGRGSKARHNPFQAPVPGLAGNKGA